MPISIMHNLFRWCYYYIFRLQYALFRKVSKIHVFGKGAYFFFRIFFSLFFQQFYSFLIFFFVLFIFFISHIIRP
ncbi:MAG: hypothetical protein E7196_10560 [Anaerovibrio lipolyticus]|nr:hypothetical protein [Anaerovibrio lipolyticus]